MGLTQAMAEPGRRKTYESGALASWHHEGGGNADADQILIRRNVRRNETALAIFYDRYKEDIMFMLLFVILLVAWLLGGFAFHVGGGLIHILLIVAVIALILHFVRRA
jgi:uncharacterized membrane protein